MTYTAIIRRNTDGLVRRCPQDLEWGENLYWWREGNMGCDCARNLEFERAGGNDEVYHIECSSHLYDLLEIELSDGWRIPMDGDEAGYDSEDWQFSVDTECAMLDAGLLAEHESRHITSVTTCEGRRYLRKAVYIYQDIENKERFRVAYGYVSRDGWKTSAVIVEGVEAAVAQAARMLGDIGAGSEA